MLNILLPLAGKSPIFEGQHFPKWIYEIKNRLMIEYPISSLGRIKQHRRFIFILRNDECIKFHLDKTLKLLTSPESIVIQQKTETVGAICSCLLAIDHINTDDPLIISNGDQFIDVDYNKVLEFFQGQDLDGGVICFNSVHPQWSYARLDAQDNIVQTAEKNPISRNAIAGFYYFKRGKDFVAAAQRTIEKEAHVNGIYYIAPTYNEMVLESKRLKAYQINGDNYYSFYSFPKIREFEKGTIVIDKI